MNIAIIGAGASGMAAAIAAAASGANQILLFERQARVGRKLLATGNGRCNLTNRQAHPGHYHGSNPDFVRPALEAYPVDSVLDFFQTLGLYTVTEDGSIPGPTRRTPWWTCCASPWPGGTSACSPARRSAA